MQLNPEQQAAVDHLYGPCVVTAVPGSGKTRTLTSRVINLIQKHKVDPKNILCLTFTKKAANEMKERISDALGADIASRVWVSTFHHLCLAMLRKYGTEVGLESGFSVYDANDQKELLRKIARMRECEGINSKTLGYMARIVNDYREDLESFDFVIDSLPPDRVSVIREYLELLDEFNAVDFSGMLYKTYKLIQKNDRVVDLLKNRFTYIMVDEGQDTNKIQYEIVKKIAGHGNLFVVGDYQQCVHESEILPVISNGETLYLTAKDIPPSGFISSYSNGSITQRGYNVQPSDSQSGVRITLECGSHLLVSDDHKVYATGPMNDDDVAVYLMYRPDIGFWLGTTSVKLLYDNLVHECATKLWVLDICDDLKSALSIEHEVSLTFGVPTVVNIDNRGTDQSRLGFKVLDHYSLHFDFPLWSTPKITGNYGSGQVRVRAHGKKGSKVSAEWFETEYCEVIKSLGVTIDAVKASKNINKRWRCSKLFDSYKSAADFAERLAGILSAPICDQLHVNEHHLCLTTASAVRIGCALPVRGKPLSLSKVVGIERLDGKFISINVDDSSVFFNGSGVLSHNSIFSWRGARPENLESIKNDFEDVREITLPRNYRSTTQILTTAERLIRNNHDAKNVELRSERGPGHDVEINVHANPKHEANAVIAKCIDLCQDYGYSWDDIAILYRTNPQSQLIEMACRNMHVPYKVYGGFSFFDRQEIKTTLSYLSFLVNPHDTIAFARAISTPARKISVTTIGKLERICQNKKVSMLHACAMIDQVPGVTAVAKQNLMEFAEVVKKHRKMQSDGIKAEAIAKSFLNESGYYGFMKQESANDDISKRRVDNIDQLLLTIADFEIQKPGATLADYLHNVQVVRSDTSENDENAVSLMTMHSAKGLEFPVVFIVGCEEGLIPHYFSVDDKSIAEERRLMYVAVTRAQGRLFLSYCEKRPSSRGNSKTHIVEPSRFLCEIGYCV